MLRRIFTEHFDIELDWTWSEFEQHKRTMDLDKILEVIGWNIGERQQIEAEYEKEKQEDKSLDTQKDTIVFCKQSNKNAGNVIVTDKSNYTAFFSLSTKKAFCDLKELKFSHPLPVPCGIKTSSDSLIHAYESKMQRWNSLYQFISAAKNHVLFSEDMKTQGVSEASLEFQIKKDLPMWILSACIALCKEHPNFQEILLATHQATLISNKVNNVDDELIMAGLQRARYNIRMSIKHDER